MEVIKSDLTQCSSWVGRHPQEGQVNPYYYQPNAQVSCDCGTTLIELSQRVFILRVAARSGVRVQIQRC